MADFQPPPTYADPVIVDPITGKSAFNPIWLKWFIDLSSNLTPGGAGSGTVTNIAETFTGGLISVSGSPITTTGTFALTVAGTSGGIPYFSSGSTWASSAALTQSALVLGGGAGSAPTALGTLGTASTVLHGNATGAPTFGAVSLTTEVSGTLPVANGGTGVTSSTGSGNVVLSTSPALTTPNIGAATATSVTMNSFNAGVWTTPTFAAGDFTASAGNWTVVAGGVSLFRYTVVNKMMTFNWFVTGTTSTTPTQLLMKLPGGVSARDAVFTTCLGNNGAWQVASCQTTAGGTNLVCYVNATVGGANWNAGTVYTAGSITFEIT